MAALKKKNLQLVANEAKRATRRRCGAEVSAHSHPADDYTLDHPLQPNAIINEARRDTLSS